MRMTPSAKGYRELFGSLEAKYTSSRWTVMEHNKDKKDLKYRANKAAMLGAFSTLALATSSAAMAISMEVGDTELSIYGYVKLDMIYDVDGVAAGARGHGDTFGFDNIAVGNEEDTGGHTNFHANQSRLGFKTTTPTESGPLVTVLEGDFLFGDLRLRHAYGSWNGILAGQTWTNFATFVAVTPTLDFGGHLGWGWGNRQAQLRYSTNGFHIALEDPGGTPSGASFEYEVVRDAERKDTLPDLTARYEGNVGDVDYAVSGVVRQVAFDNGDEDDSAVGWGLNVAGSYELPTGTTLRAQAVGGDGIGAYLSNYGMAAAAYRIGSELETLRGWGGTLGLSQPVGIGAINLQYSYVTFDWDDAEADGLDMDDVDEERQLVHLNYIWSPRERITYGVEVAWADRQTVEGESGDATRLQASVIYSF